MFYLGCPENDFVESVFVNEEVARLLIQGGLVVFLRYVSNTLIASTLVAITVARADPELGAHKNLEGAVQPDPTYVSGRPVLYFSVSKYALAEVGVTLAYSLYNSHGYPVIFYDEESLAKLPDIFQRWIFGHEVEHFKLGHFDAQIALYQKSVGFEGVQYSYEQAADCAAVKMLQYKYFITREEVVQIAQTAQVVFHGKPLQRKSQRNSSNYAHEFGYGEPSERAEKIIACYEND